MTVAIAVVVGLLAARLVWVLTRPIFAADLFQRKNYRGRDLPTGVGLVIALAALLVEAGRVSVSALADGASGPGPGRSAVVMLVIGLGFVGMLDDLAGGGERRGFRGHVRALAEGRMTTGGVKMLGGGAIAVLAVAIARPDTDIGELLADAALVALAANLGNLFDLAPGRAIKVSVLAFVALVTTTAADPRLSGPAVVIGAATGLLRDDLRERLMLGDAGANVLGGALGLGVVIVGSPVVRLATLGVLAILNGMSEWVSFSRVIERVVPLRLLDQAGRRE